MTFKLVDRVRETCISPGTGTVALIGAALGYQTFSAGVGANNTTYYVIADQSGANWEVGYGTVGALGTTLARTTVLSSSNGGSLVNFSSGTQDVWVDYPATKAVFQDSTGTVSVPVLLTTSITSTTPNLSFNGSNTGFSAGASISGSYLQSILQNKSGTAGASTNYVLSNDLGTDSTYYGEFGMNSSVYSGSTPSDFFSINNGIYFSGHDGDISIGSGNGFKTYLAWGTTGQSAHVINASGALGFSTNLGTTPALSGTTGYGTAGQVLFSAGNAAAPAWGSLTPAQVSDQTNTSTGAFALPAGTTAQRPVLPAAGYTRFNTTTGYDEYWDGTNWNSIAAPYTVNYLVIAGGGAGGGTYAGGGGAGGYIASNSTVNPNTPYVITIGSGGTSSQGNVQGGNGSNTSFGSITAIGGGGGGQWNDGSAVHNGTAGGSGGGGGGVDGTGTFGTGGAGTSGQGNNGGNSSNGSGSTSGGGGGGGAGSAGTASSGSGSAIFGGPGGNGSTWSVDSVTRAGGGGGGVTGAGNASGTAGTGGTGGGGAGGKGSTAAVSGTINTGGGGGGSGGIGNGYTGSGAPGNGGSGVVIISYTNATQKGTGGTVTSSGSGASTVWKHTFTSSGTYTG